MGDESGPLSRAAARAIVRLRWLVVAAWVVAAVAGQTYLPGLGSLPPGGLDFLIPKDTPALAVQQEALERFGVPLLSQLAVVQRKPAGLSRAEQVRVARQALDLSRGRLAGFPPDAVAVPLVNGPQVPGVRERSTTAISYLFFPPSVGANAQRDLAIQYAEIASLPGAPGRATGPLLATLEQSDALESALPTVTLATLAAVVLIVALYFRSLLAPVVLLISAAIAYVLSLGVVSWVAQRTGSAVPREIEPLVVVLLLGVITDYATFFLTAMRDGVRAGAARLPAARAATGGVLPIILAAGLIVAGGVATLVTGQLEFLKTLGPAMAITVLVAVLVSITLVPALMAVLGRALFWPGLRGRRREGSQAASAPPQRPPRWLRALTRRRTAVAVTAAVSAILLVAAAGLSQIRLTVSPVQALPATAAAQEALEEASLGFAAGILGPTELVLIDEGTATRTAAPARLATLPTLAGVRTAPIGSRTADLARLARAIDRVPGVAASVSPPERRSGRGLFRSRDGSAARVLVVLEGVPSGAAAIGTVRELKRRLPDLLAAADLTGVRAGFGGPTALAGETTEAINHDLVVVGAAALLVNFVLLALFLRALVAPLYLVASSALAVAATFGVTSLVFQGALDFADLTYYVPVAVAVLLLSLGSDYNVFIVGRIHQAARSRSIREAVLTAVPPASRAVDAAGVALALSFAALALVPLAPFRQLAFAMAFGILLDTFVVRTVLVPAVMVAVGERSWWPRRRPAPIGDAVADD